MSTLSTYLDLLPHLSPSSVFIVRGTQATKGFVITFKVKCKHLCFMWESFLFNSFEDLIDIIPKQRVTFKTTMIRLTFFFGMPSIYFNLNQISEISNKHHLT